MKRWITIITQKLLVISFFANCYSAPAQNNAGYLDTTKSFQQRAWLLLNLFTTEEKIAYLQYRQPAIKRLHIPSYNWWNEALHGVARNGVATVFPQAIGMAATWNPALIKGMGDVVSTEARAKYSYALQKNDSNAIYQGLTFWSPNINIFRDPRWGRGQETYGEDPFLTSQIGMAYVKGLQGNDPKYLKVAATAKHFAVHSGPESTRHLFDARVSNKDLYETYLPAFEMLVKNAKVEGVMCAYNRLAGIPCCANATLLKEILKDKWHFSGHVVTDCWAMTDMVKYHKTYATAADAAVASLLAGSDLSCGPEMGAIKEALQKDSTLIKNIDSALFHLLLTRFKLGMFDPPEMVPFSTISMNQNNSQEHRALSKQVALESMVLLKNKDDLLPLKKNISSIAIIGPYANDVSVLLGNYNGTPSAPVTFLQGIKAKAGANVKIFYAEGTNKPDKKYAGSNESQDSLKKALSLVANAEVIIVVAGISPKLEGEAGETNVMLDGFYKGDRTLLDIPKDQEDMIKALYKTRKKIVLVLTGGSALSINWEKQNIPAILQAWYPGQEAGNALADILFGDYNPAGRLPVTFYKSVNDLPLFEDYNMKGRTYRYFKKETLFPFGYGLSYSNFKYNKFWIDKNVIHQKDSIALSIDVKNTGKYEGDEVVQLYIKKRGENAEQYPIRSLQGFKRMFFKRNQTLTIPFLLASDQFRYYDEASGNYKIAAGDYELQVGASSEDIKLRIPIKIN